MRAPWPLLRRSPTHNYEREQIQQRSGWMASLALRPSGEHRSRMTRHLFCPLLGITPNRLVWSPGTSSGWKEPRALPFSRSRKPSRMPPAMYSANCLSGWAASALALSYQSRGEVFPVSAWDTVLGGEAAQLCSVISSSVYQYRSVYGGGMRDM